MHYICLYGKKKEVSALPLWVKFPGLRLHLWSEKMLGKIVSVIGKPLFIDKLTVDIARLSYPRVCIEVNAEDGLPNSIEIQDYDGKKS